MRSACFFGGGISGCRYHGMSLLRYFVITLFRYNVIPSSRDNDISASRAPMLPARMKRSKKRGWHLVPPPLLIFQCEEGIFLSSNARKELISRSLFHFSRSFYFTFQGAYFTLNPMMRLTSSMVARALSRARSAPSRAMRSSRLVSALNS